MVLVVVMVDVLVVVLLLVVLMLLLVLLVLVLVLIDVEDVGAVVMGAVEIVGLDGADVTEIVEGAEIRAVVAGAVVARAEPQNARLSMRKVPAALPAPKPNRPTTTMAELLPASGRVWAMPAVHNALPSVVTPPSNVMVPSK